MKRGGSKSAPVATVEEYLANIPPPARKALQQLRATIRSAAPREATEEISYGIPSFRHQGALVYYAAFAKHCSFFPASLSLLGEFKTELKDFEVSKGTIHFSPQKPLPAALIKKIVRGRVAQNENKAALKGKPKAAQKKQRSKSKSKKS